MIEYINPTNILDLFGGSAICSLYFQLQNINVVYNDILKFNCLNSYGFLNTHLDNIPSQKDIYEIFEKKDGITYNIFISEQFKNIYFTDDENLQLDIFNGNINHYTDNEIKKNIMYYLLFQSLISKRPYNLFHRKNLHIRLADVKRSFGNKVTWDKSFIEHMIKFRKELISIVEYKNKNNICPIYNVVNYSYNEIPTTLLSDIDTIYIDPPYFKKNSKNNDYLTYYHFIEGFVYYDKWESLINYSSKNLTFKNNDNIIINSAYKMFVEIINKFKEKNLIISYKIDAYPSINELEDILKTHYTNIIIHYIDYKYALSKNKTQEVIIIALNI